MAITMVHKHRLEGNEPLVFAGGLGILGATLTMPMFWSRGVTPIPPCIFHTLTGQPCPFCGATRSFVWTAQGHLGPAFQVFPIGPFLFLALFVAVAYTGFALVTGKRIRVEVSPNVARAFYIGLLLILALNWMSKLFVLGYGPPPYPGG